MREAFVRLKMFAVAGLLMGIGVMAAGCNTVQGIGEDVSAAGQTVADWADSDDDQGG